VLLDFTAQLPAIDSDSCFTSVVARIRTVEKLDYSVWYYDGNALDQNGLRLFETLVKLQPIQEFKEGRDQNILDFRLVPPPDILREAHQPNSYHSFRVLSAYRVPDRPWATCNLWLVVFLGNPTLGVAPILQVGALVTLGLPSLDLTSRELPKAPFPLPAPTTHKTRWDRIADE
jgi:hypothetical protein